jgi:hypothetical protein
MKLQNETFEGGLIAGIILAASLFLTVQLVMVFKGYHHDIRGT